jgi:hypothetical protein
MSLSEVKKDVAANMKQIADSFIEEAYRDNLAMCGTKTTPPFSDTVSTATDIGFFVNKLFSNGYTNFETQYNSEITTGTPQIAYRAMNSTDTYTLCNVSSLTVSTLANFVTGKAGLTSSNVELSFYPMISVSGNLLTMMNKIRTIYSLLDDANYKNYLYRLENPTVSSVTVKTYKYDGTSETHSSLQQINTLKGYIQQLKGNSSTLTTKNIESFMVDTTQAKVFSILSTNDSSLPQEVRGDDIAFVVPAFDQNVTSVLENVIMVSGDNTNVQSSSKQKKFYTFSCYVRTASGMQITDATALQNLKTYTSNVLSPTSTITIDMIASDNGNSTTIRNANIKYYERMEFPVTQSWQRVHITREIDIPAFSSIDIKLNLTFSNDVQSTGDVTVNSVSKKGSANVVAITGVQAFIDTTDPKGQLAKFKPPQFDMTRTNRLVIRRLLLMYELVAMYYIAVRNVVGNSNNGASRNLLNIVYEYMLNYNRNILRSNGTDKNFISSLSTSVNNKITEYATKSEDLTKASIKLKDDQYDLRDKVSTMNSEKTKAAKTKTFMIVAGTMFSVVCVACIVVYFLPIEQKQKVAACLGVAAVGLIVVLIFHLVYTETVKEPFQANLLTSPATFVTGTESSDIENIKTNSGYVALSFAKDYLDNTINIALMIQTYIGYGKINQSLSKEQTYYDGVKQQMITSDSKIRAATNVHANKRFMNRALISLLVSISIIVIVSFVLLSSLRQYPIATPIVLTLSAIASMFALLMYFLDSVARVRTASRNMYWGTPNIRNL